MKKALTFKSLIFASFVAATTIGCKKDEKVHNNTVMILSGSNPGINTCGWIIRVNQDNSTTNPQNSFKPLNLDQQYQTDGMRVNITYTIPDMPAIKCGFNSNNLPGYTQINILSIQQAN
jgi:hypothetical protein